jgi:hypothetical protein
MKKSNMNAVEPAKTELEAPVQLTPEQLEIVAAGFMANRVLVRDILKDITIFGRFPMPTLPTKTVLF